MGAVETVVEPAGVVDPLLPPLMPLATTSTLIPSYSMVAAPATTSYAAPAYATSGYSVAAPAYSTSYAAPATTAYAAPAYGTGYTTGYTTGTTGYATTGAVL